MVLDIQYLMTSILMFHYQGLDLVPSSLQSQQAEILCVVTLPICWLSWYKLTLERVLGTKNLRAKQDRDFINIANFNEGTPKIAIRHSWKESLLAPNHFISISISTGGSVYSSWDYVLWNNYYIWINSKLSRIWRNFQTHYLTLIWIRMVMHFDIDHGSELNYFISKLFFLNSYSSTDTYCAPSTCQDIFEVLKR